MRYDEFETATDDDHLAVLEVDDDNNPQKLSFLGFWSAASCGRPKR